MVNRITDLDSEVTAQRDLQFIQKTIKFIAAFAWKSFNEKGKGVVVINLKLMQTEAALNDFFIFISEVAYFCANTFNDEGFTPEQRATILHIINTYDPNIGAAVLCMDKTHINIYKISTLPLPPVAYEELRGNF